MSGFTWSRGGYRGEEGEVKASRCNRENHIHHKEAAVSLTFINLRV